MSERWGLRLSELTNILDSLADEMLLSVGKQYPEATAFISYENNISYILKNFKL